MSLPSLKRSKVVLERLEKLLGCDFCKQRPSSNQQVQLSLIGPCDHMFCNQCISKDIGHECPICRAKASAKDARPVRMLAEIADLCGAMRFHLDEYEKSDANENLNEKSATEEYLNKNADDGEISNGSGLMSMENGNTPKKQHDGDRTRSPVHLRIKLKLSDKTVAELAKGSGGKKKSQRIKSNEKILPVAVKQKSQSLSSKKRQISPTSEAPMPAKRKRRSHNSQEAAGATTKTHGPTEEEPSPGIDGSQTVEATDETEPLISGNLSEILPMTQGTNASDRSSGNATGNSSSFLSPYDLTLKKHTKAESALHKACQKGDLDCVRELLFGDNPADPNVFDHSRWTPLHDASHVGRADIVACLVNAGAVVDSVGEGFFTPLHIAVQRGQLEVVDVLVQHGADINAKTIYGDTALTLADKCVLNKEEIKSALAFALNLPDRPTPILANHKIDRIGILYSYLEHDNIRCILNQMVSAKKFGGKANVVMQFDPKTTTHLIMGDSNPPRSFKYLAAILTGKWILTFDWISACVQEGRFVDEEPFEIKGSKLDPLSCGPERGRQNLLLLKPGLFEGCKFIVHGDFQGGGLSKDTMRQLIRFGKGTIEKRLPTGDAFDDSTKPYHADETWQSPYVILCDQSNLKPGKRSLHTNIHRATSNWLVDCIDQFRLLPFPQ